MDMRTFFNEKVLAAGAGAGTRDASICSHGGRVWSVIA